MIPVDERFFLRKIGSYLRKVRKIADFCIVLCSRNVIKWNKLCNRQVKWVYLKYFYQSDQNKEFCLPVKSLYVSHSVRLVFCWHFVTQKFLWRFSLLLQDDSDFYHLQHKNGLFMAAFFAVALVMSNDVRLGFWERALISQLRRGCINYLKTILPKLSRLSWEIPASHCVRRNRKTFIYEVPLLIARFRC